MSALHVPRVLTTCLLAGVVAAGLTTPTLQATTAEAALVETPPGQAPAGAGRPNLLLITVDDARADDVRRRYMPRTGALLARRGVTFERFYSPFPVCCPARATLLTGQYSHNHGVVANSGQGYEVFDDRRTLATWLDKRYRTGHVGKYLNGYGVDRPRYVPPGWDFWRAPLQRNLYKYKRFQVNEDGAVRRVRQYTTSYTGDEAVQFLDQRSERPFFLSVSFIAPHDGRPHTDDRERLKSPFVVPKYQDTYEGPRLPKDRSFNEADVSDKNPRVAKRSRLDAADRAFLREKLAQRRESLRSVDDQIGRMLEKLQRSGELSDTYVLLTSDNGFLLGEHRIRAGKRHLYEPSARVPLLMRGPGVPQGRSVSALTAQIDVAPTLLEAAGIRPTRRRLGLAVDGRSLLDTLDGAPPRAIVLERHTRVTESDPGRWNGLGLVLPKWSFLRFPTFGDFEELYDLRKDRFQQQNVAQVPRYARQLDRIRGLWQRYRRCAGARCR